MMFDAYTGNQKQTLLSLLVTAESNGITDIHILRERLQRAVDCDYKQKKLRMTPEQKADARVQKKLIAANRKQGVAVDQSFPGSQVCPDCGRQSLIVAQREDNGELVRYQVCALVGNTGSPVVGCGFSRAVR
jgi:hypothetical protein